MSTTRRVLLVGGVDPTGRSGLAADLRTLASLGVHGMPVVTALTAQGSAGVSRVWSQSAALIRAQVRAAVCDVGVDAVKTGLLARAEAVEAVVEEIRDLGVPVVVDPVGSASAGGRLADDDAVEALLELLLPVCSLVTPNVTEAERLSGLPVDDAEGQGAAAAELVRRGAAWVLVKGGHLSGPARDLLTDGEDQEWLITDRIDSAHTRGTGCTMATAIAARLADGLPMLEAVSFAKDFVTEAIRAAGAIGAHPGPVDQRAAARALGL